MRPTISAIFFILYPPGMKFPVLRGCIVAMLTHCTFKRYYVSFFICQLSSPKTHQIFVIKNTNLKNYSTIPVTTPAPTVLPPSLIANLNPSSIAIGEISSPVILTSSPGITISTPSGSDTVPVTSVVLK